MRILDLLDGLNWTLTPEQRELRKRYRKQERAYWKDVHVQIKWDNELIEYDGGVYPRGVALRMYARREMDLLEKAIHKDVDEFLAKKEGKL